MRRNNRICLLTLGIVLVLLMSNGLSKIDIVKAVIEDNTTTLSSNGKTKQIVSDFSGFKLSWPRPQFLYNNTDDYISIRCNATNYLYITYFLNISKYWINGTNADFEIKFDYDFTEGGTLLRFSFSSAYTLTGESLRSWFDLHLLGYADLREYDCRVATDFADYHAAYKNHKMGLKNSATLFLKKQTSSMKCGVKDNEGKTILSRKWCSLEYYIPLNYILITFISDNIGNEVNITSIDGVITLQDRNWFAMILAYRIAIGVAITIVAVLVVVILIRRKLSKFRREEIYRKLNKDEMSKDEYIARLEKALQ